MEKNALSKILGNNMMAYMERLNLTQVEVAEYMGCTQATVSSWCRGIKSPRMDKIDKLCTLFGCSRSALMEEHRAKTKEEVLQAAFERPEMRMLFSVAEDCTAEEIEQAIKIIEALKK